MGSHPPAGCVVLMVTCATYCQPAQRRYRTAGTPTDITWFWRSWQELQEVLAYPRRTCVLADATLPVEVIVLIDIEKQHLLLGELIVAWEEGIEETHERKLLQYEKLVAEVCERGYGCTLAPFEVGCRVFPVASLKRFLKYAGIQIPNKVIKTCGEKVVESSVWITQKFLLNRMQLT